MQVWQAVCRDPVAGKKHSLCSGLEMTQIPLALVVVAFDVYLLPRSDDPNVSWTHKTTHDPARLCATHLYLNSCLVAIQTLVKIAALGVGRVQPSFQSSGNTAVADGNSV